MSTNIYVGNLPFSSTEAQVHDLFSTYGPVEAVKLITDRDTGRPRGFGFVEMSESDDAAAAIQALDKQDFGDPPRPLTVNLARPRGERPRQNSNRW